MFFQSSVRSEVMKVINNRIKNAEIAYKAEVKDLKKQHNSRLAQIMKDVADTLQKLRAEYVARKNEILQKRVADILAKVL